MKTYFTGAAPHRDFTSFGAAVAGARCTAAARSGAQWTATPKRSLVNRGSKLALGLEAGQPASTTIADDGREAAEEHHHLRTR